MSEGFLPRKAARGFLGGCGALWGRAGLCRIFAVRVLRAVTLGCEGIRCGGDFKVV